MSVSCQCCAFSGRGLCDKLISWPEESYRWCVIVCDLETPRMRRPGPLRAVASKRKKSHTDLKKIICYLKCEIELTRFCFMEFDKK